MRNWSYDAAGRDTAETDDNSHTERRWFGASGLLDSTLTRDTLKVRRKYDAAGHLTDLVYAAHDDSSYSLGDSVHYVYDAAGRLDTATNRNSRITRQYNREGTIRQEQDSAVVGGYNTYNVIRRYKYWQDDMPDSVWDYPAAGGDTIKLSYPGYDLSPDRLTKIVIRYPTGGPDDTATYTWDPLSRRQQLLTPIHATVGWLYDADGRVRRVRSTHQCTGNCIGHDSAQVDVQYQAYDRMGRPQSVFQTISTATTKSDSFAYDPYGQMRFQRQGGNDAKPPVTYTYDLSGNILTQIDSTGVGLRYTMSPGHNQLLYDTSLTPGNVVGRMHYWYSAAGERIGDVPYNNMAMLRYEWYDALGRMTSFGREGVYQGVIAATVLPFDALGYTHYTYLPFVDACRYDALGRRIQACGSEPLVFEGDHVVRVVNPDGGSRIIYGPSLDDPLVVYTHETWQVPDTLRQYFLTDGAGRMLAYTDHQGNDATDDSHDVYNKRAIHAQVVAHLGFGASAGEIANFAYVSFFRNRYYDQRTGRWMQEDPIGPEGGTNLYAYVGNSPASYTDPFGLCPPCVVEGGELLAAGVYALGAAIFTGAAVELHHLIGQAFASAHEAPTPTTPSEPERSIDNPGSLAGATPGEVEKAVPEGWVKEPSRRGEGTRWLNPDAHGEAVRVQPGNPTADNPVKRGPYVRVSKDGNTSPPIPLRGNPTLPQP
jgi:RHS repeat-associated protein